MKKTLLTERFQQLAGLKPLYENLDPGMYDQKDIDKFQAMLSHLQSQPSRSVSYSARTSRGGYYDRTFALTRKGDIHFTISWKGEGYEEGSQGSYIK